MKFNRGLVPEPDSDKRDRDLIQVHAQDTEGFWTVVTEPASVKMAIRVAHSWHEAERVPTRVCVGVKQQVVRSFGA